MAITLFTTGLIIVLITMYDITDTILAPRGVGLIANRVSRGLWRFVLVLSGKNGKNKYLKSVGPGLLLVIIFIWILLIWIGNTLMVYSDPHAIWSPAKNQFVEGFVETSYFVAYVLSSMGSGDYNPISDWWLFYTGFISYTGVVFISLSISFLIPIIDAIALKRTVSLQIHALGKTPKEILTGHSEDKYDKLLSVLDDLQPSLLKLAQYHLAYPVIHFFHSEHLFESLPVKLVSLDETMSIMLYKINKDQISDHFVLERAYEATTFCLTTLASAYIKPSDDDPKYPDVSYLEHVTEDYALKAVDGENSLKHRRRILLAYLQNDGWEWDDMDKGGDPVQINQ